ncbi:Nat2 protein [Starmerella bacillaris]|uniref:Nat2 protein n=1 Tax=Starmerella bacillaris TaxID=1247836 RepID=A0AAV5RPG1_STABA|nr:Nat2 protein [Starmerella bacillaris]
MLPAMNAMRILNRSPSAILRRMYSSSPPKKLSLKEIVKKYGWTATGVYTALCFIDLPLSYVFVHNIGQEKLIDYEVYVREKLGANNARDKTYIYRSSSGGKNHFLTELGIAYIIHKSLIIVRAPLTVFLTPRIAHHLHKWGLLSKKHIT